MTGKSERKSELPRESDVIPGVNVTAGGVFLCRPDEIRKFGNPSFNPIPPKPLTIVLANLVYIGPVVMEGATASRSPMTGCSVGQYQQQHSEQDHRQGQDLTHGEPIEGEIADMGIRPANKLDQQAKDAVTE